MERDIIERLTDFENGNSAGERVKMREEAAVEIFTLRDRIASLRAALEVISGSSDRVRAMQAVAALDNIGPKV
jgi:hypothetical protein